MPPTPLAPSTTRPERRGRPDLRRRRPDDRAQPAALSKGLGAAGGHVGAGEARRVAAARELAKESGVHVPVGNFDSGWSGSSTPPPRRGRSESGTRSAVTRVRREGFSFSGG
ncbi:NUDIX domain-containing protein [Streptomyces sp. DK15]|uniref:NUDIX domain-containing protein n=1 Tax=Streptomyces sp. DK15 TaxID=2957499 RepID=UPI00301B5D06